MAPIRLKHVGAASAFETSVFVLPFRDIQHARTSTHLGRGNGNRGFRSSIVIESKGSKHLADVGPEAVKQIDLKEGDKVTVTGEQKPSEIKVTEIVKAGGTPIRIEHKKKHDHEEPHAFRDPKAAIEALMQDGFKVIAEPRRKPKHFEILGRSAKGEVLEFHVGLDGDIRKRKPADLNESKWKSAAPAA